MDNNKSVLENIKENYTRMFTAEKKVADYILGNPEKAVMTNVSELAELSGASDATVIRMSKRVGYEGYYQMKIKLSHDLGKDRMLQLQTGNQQPETVKDVFQVIVSNMIHTAECLDTELIQKCVDLIKGSRTVYVIATGNTTPVAMDMAFRLGRFGIHAVSSVIPEYFLGYIGLADEMDLVIGITHSGSSKNVIQALELARERGMKTIAITDAAKSPVARVSDYILCTSVSNPIFHDYGPTSHVYELAVIDTILYFIAHKDGQQVDKVELILSEYKV